MKAFLRLNRQLLDYEAGIWDVKREVVNIETREEIRVTAITDAIEAVFEAVINKKRVKMDVRPLDQLHAEVLGVWLTNLKVNAGHDIFMWSEEGFLAEVNINLGTKATHQGQELGGG